VVLARQRDQTAQIPYLVLSLLLVVAEALQQLVLVLLEVLAVVVDIVVAQGALGLQAKETQVARV
jgi:hypothetical protein